MDYRKWIGASGVTSGMVVAVINYIQGDVVLATVLVVLLITLLGVLVLRTRRNGSGGMHTSHAAAHAAASKDEVIVYWRPGCIHCDRLKLGLGRARHDVSWVNILRDSKAAEFVATYRDGNATVPTAITGTGEMIDATPEAIKAHLRSALKPRSRRR